MSTESNSHLARTTLFKKGNSKPKNSGRTRGSRNKTTLVLREAALYAAEACGEDGMGKNGLVGFLMSLAQNQPAVFGRLLVKILPMKTSCEQTVTGRLTMAEATTRLRERGLP